MNVPDNSEICEAARRRYNHAFSVLKIYTVSTVVLTCMFVLFVGWVLYKLIDEGTLSEAVVPLVGSIASGAIGAWVINRRNEASTDEERTYQEMKKACGPGIAEAERSRLKAKRFL